MKHIIWKIGEEKTIETSRLKAKHMLAYAAFFGVMVIMPVYQENHYFNMLAAKAYYFKVRAYGAAEGKTVYGAYSQVKSVKTK